MKKKKSYNKPYNKRNAGPIKRYLKSEKGKAAFRKYQLSVKGIFATYKARAKYKKIPFTLPLKLFEEWYNKTECHYCGDTVLNIGIDRINSELGYDITNVVPCCSICNYMKLDMATGDFLNHIQKIHKKSNK